MKILPLTIDDALDAELDKVSVEQGRDKAEIAIAILRRFIASEQLKRQLSDPNIIALYESLADEDSQLAEEGMADYASMLDEADRP